MNIYLAGGCFYSAEEYHQKYLVRNPHGYCHLTLQTLQFAKTYSKITESLRSRSDEEKKAVGWMLREVGKKDESLLLEFLDRHCLIMPRTMLRYAIEKLSQHLREAYMKGLTRHT